MGIVLLTTVAGLVSAFLFLSLVELLFPDEYEDTTIEIKIAAPVKINNNIMVDFKDHSNKIIDKHTIYNK